MVPGYTANGGDGSPELNNKHGQCVAGIITAHHNNTGVRGVASNVRLMSIKIFDNNNALYTTEQVFRAIDTAWIRGAHILNNSWGMDEYHDNIAQAITRALTLGRGGKGCLVVKSAGNTGSHVTFPGTVPGVLVVGAVTNLNNPASYTPRSSRVDVVAPSDDGTLGITTTDRMGSTGYVSGNYNHNFTGTSAAAPQVSGIGALILSVNPNLDARAAGTNPNPQVQNIIKQTAYDYGATNWDGHGRVSTIKAVANAYVLANPQYTFTTGTAPMSRQQSNFWVSFTAAPRSDIAAGTYYCDRYVVDVTIGGYTQTPQAWYLPPPGFSFANPNNAQEWLEKTTTSTSVRFRTVFYYIKSNTIGQTINKWAPFDPNPNYLREYAALGMPLVTPVISGFTQTPSPICAGATGTVRCNLSQGNGNITYNWSFTDKPSYVNVSFSGNIAYVTNYGSGGGSGPFDPKLETDDMKRPPFALHCTAINAAGSSTSSFYPYLSDCGGGGGGCPFVYTWNGSEFVEDNNILPQSEYVPNEDGFVIDHYQLFTTPVLTENTYRLRVGEFEQERSYLDKFSLIVIDHEPEASVSVSEDGTISQYAKPAAIANAQLDNDDVFKLVYELDNNFVEAQADETLQLTFEEQQNGVEKALLISAVLPPGEEKKLIAGIAKQSAGGGIDGKLINTHQFRLRRNPSFIWIPVEDEQSKDGNLEIEITWQQKANVDFTELSHKLDLPYTTYVCDLTLAEHSQLGDVIELLSEADGSVSVLNPGEYVDLVFDAPPLAEGKKRSFVFVSRGRYERIENLKESATDGLAIKNQQTTSSISQNIPTKYALHQNHPNPFNPVTTIKYELPEISNVVLKIYDILGKEVATLVNRVQDAGYKEVVFDASRLTSGVYLYKLQAGTYTKVKKMVLMR